MTRSKDEKPPRLRGETLEALRRAPAREDERGLTLEERPAQVIFSTSRERGAVALGCLLLEEFRRAGGALIEAGALERVLERMFAAMTHEERVAIEVEAYEILRWIGESLSPDIAAREHAVPPHVGPSSSHRDIIRWAIKWGRDLFVEYYDLEHGEVVEHKITPMSLEADVYLRAISHTTLDERIYEVLRISEVTPAEGWQVRRRAHQHPSPPPIGRRAGEAPVNHPSPSEEEKKQEIHHRNEQMSLLGEEE